jgi:glycosyltransferase involved in cell wall biosynthesis
MRVVILTNWHDEIARRTMVFAAFLVRRGFEVIVLARKTPTSRNSLRCEGVKILWIEDNLDFLSGLYEQTDLSAFEQQSAAPAHRVDRDDLWRRLLRWRPRLHAKPKHVPNAQGLLHPSARCPPLNLPELDPSKMNAWQQAFYHRCLYFDPDIVHVEGLNQLCPGLAAAHRLGVPVVYDILETFAGSEVVSPKTDLALRDMEAALISHCNELISQSATLARSVQNALGCAPIRLILSPGTPPMGFVRGCSDDRIRRSFGLAKGARIVLAWRCDDDQFALLAGALRRTIAHVHIVFATDDVTQWTVTRDGMGDRLHQLPPISRDELIWWAAAADAAIVFGGTQNSSRHSVPDELYDFIAAAVPIVADNLPFVRELLLSERFGIVRDLHTQIDIADAFNELFANDGAIAKTARDNLLQRGGDWDWELESKKLLGVYSRLARTAAHQTR